MAMKQDHKPKKPGPKAETLKLEGDWEDAAAKAINLPKPPGGWPKPEKRTPKKPKP